MAGVHPDPDAARTETAPPGAAPASPADGPSPAPSTPRGRILGIDAARALAVIGMAVVHLGPTDAPGLGGRAYALTHGRASILFVLLAGVGVSLLAGDRSRARLRGARVSLAWRAAVLLPLGLALQALDHGVLVILQYYAMYYVVAGLAAALRDRVLLGLTGAVAVAGPLLHLGVWHLRPAWFELDPTGFGEPAQVIVRQLWLSGSYPVLVWSAPLLLGLWLGRRDLRDRRLGWRLVGWGTAVAVAARTMAALGTALLGEPPVEPSWGMLVLDTPHSEMPLWLIGSTGAAVAVLGASLLLCERLPRLTWPLAATGQLAFTIYVSHLLVLHLATDLLRYDEVGSAAASVARFTAVVVAASVLWRLVLPRGPLELLLRPPWTWRRRG